MRRLRSRRSSCAQHAVEAIDQSAHFIVVVFLGPQGEFLGAAHFARHHQQCIDRSADDALQPRGEQECRDHRQAQRQTHEFQRATQLHVQFAQIGADVHAAGHGSGPPPTGTWIRAVVSPLNWID